MRLSGIRRPSWRKCFHLLLLASLGSLVWAVLRLFHHTTDHPLRSDLQSRGRVSLHKGPPASRLHQRLRPDSSDPGSDDDDKLEAGLKAVSPLVAAKGSSERRDLSEGSPHPFIDDVPERLTGTNPVSQPSPDVRRADDVTMGEACPDVLSGLAHGRWVPKANVGESRRLEMDRYLQHLRREFFIPDSLQRDDGRCGDVAYDGVPQYRHMWFRAVCDPVGPTPCCENFRCRRSVTTADCACTSCIDSRTPVHAELSDWLPANRACAVRELSTSQACAVLKGTSLFLAGDSFVRHVFVALVLLLSGNFENGALGEEPPSDIRPVCQGMFQINGLRCRDFLAKERTLCDGSVNVTYLEVFWAANGSSSVVSWLRNRTSQDQKVLLVTGLGIHDNFRLSVVWSSFLKPLLDYFRSAAGDRPHLVDGPVLNITEFDYPGRMLLNAGSPSRSLLSSSSSADEGRPLWPKCMWANTHAPGLLKSPLFPAQSFEGVNFYNKGIARLLEPYGVPTLDSFNLTAPLHSVDGTHYGYGANMLKVQILLSWVVERQERGEW